RHRPPPAGHPALRPPHPGRHRRTPRRRTGPRRRTRPGPGLAELDRLEGALDGGVDDPADRERLAARLRELLGRLDPAATAGDGTAADSLEDRMDGASDDELFDLIDNELGLS
ncbi:hypothetical protein GTX14_07760, partial [Streptomyces sp. SID4944]|nr:hypothetical protein [Streptomyces sp. SID4944]